MIPFCVRECPCARIDCWLDCAVLKDVELKKE
jgi:hypothetical protein